MLKDYLILEDSPLSPEIDFVEEMWTEKFMSSVHTASKEDLTKRDEFRLIKSYLEELQKGAKILDGGCGRGEWVTMLSTLGFKVTGIDISKRLIETLKATYPDICFLRGDIRKTEFEADHFDAYFSWGAFEHFEIGLMPCLEEAYRIIKPGGLLFFSVPFANRRQLKKHESGLMKKHFNIGSKECSKDRLQFYQWRLTVGEVAREIIRVGFTPIDIHPIHKNEGLRRMLKSDYGINLVAGSFLEMVFLKILRKLIPSQYVSHMILSVARK